MQGTWNFVWNNLFDVRTGMFYNHLVGHEKGAATKYLPSPEMIRLLLPNPGGYGTGMEDCMLNAGLMMDAVIARFEVTGDHTMAQYADRIFSGMALGATVSSQKGFLPRGVSPEDCKSHFIDTSRDQYTNWLYAAYRFYFSPLSSEEQREKIRHILTNMAEKMEEEVTAQNQWCFLREDGKKGIAGKMWGDLHPHEYLRLPMLYLLTWNTTQNKHWLDMYLRYREEAVEKSLLYVPLSGPTYAALQMQYSMRLIYDLEDDVAIRSTLENLMLRLAGPYEALAVKQAEALMTPEGKSWLEIQYIPWQDSKHRFAGTWGGMGYFVPEPSDFREHQSYYPLRAAGEGISIAAMCPGWKIKEASLDQLCKMADSIAYNKHSTCAPIALLEAYWLARRSHSKHPNPTILPMQD